MVDVSRMPESAFGYVPTPALVAPSNSRSNSTTIRLWAATWIGYAR